MTISLILATAMTVRGLTAVTSKPFHYKLAQSVSECVLKPPSKAQSKASKSIPSGINLAADSTLSGTVTDGEGIYTFGVACKERKFNVTIRVNELE